MTTVTLARDTNQALGLGRFAVDFMGAAGVGDPAPAVLDRTLLFFTDSVVCGLSAIALGTNAPARLRAEALEYERPGGGVPIFGSDRRAGERWSGGLGQRVCLGGACFI